MVTHQEKELQRLANDKAEKFLLKHAVTGRYLNFNKKTANQYKVNMSLSKTSALSCFTMQLPASFFATLKTCRMSPENTGNVYYMI